GNDWYEYIRHNNTTKSHTNSSFKLSLTLRSVRLEDTTLADHMSQVYERSLPSVVEIYQKSGMGTGVVVDAELGLIVTNCHVVQDWEFGGVKLNLEAKRYQLFDAYASDDKVGAVRAHVLYCRPEVDLAVICLYTIPGALPALKLSKRMSQHNGRLIGISLNTFIRSDGIFFAADIIAFVKRGSEFETRDRDMKYSFANRKSLGVVLYKDMNASNKVFKKMIKIEKQLHDVNIGIGRDWANIVFRAYRRQQRLQNNPNVVLNDDSNEPNVTITIWRHDLNYLIRHVIVGIDDKAVEQMDPKYRDKVKARLNTGRIPETNQNSTYFPHLSICTARSMSSTFWTATPLICVITSNLSRSGL
ncbi:unnamed protein product, partial [Medioppia subpectinata]